MSEISVNAFCDSRLTKLVAPAILVSISAGAFAESTHAPDRSQFHAPQALVAPVIDGTADESIWKDAPWRAINHRWLGPEYLPQDFQGRFKVVWTSERIFILAEIVDDILFDSHRDPLVQYWDDDCLEIFLDEDYSGGDHQYNHNAFAYHLSLDNRAIDIGTNEKAQDYSSHVDSRWRQQGNTITWELSIAVYADDYIDGSADNTPVALSAGKVMGLMLAYCDNDGSELRENFVGSESVPSGPKDRGWMDAGLFGQLLLEGAK